MVMKVALFSAAERGLIPDNLIRFGIRRLCQQLSSSLNEPNKNVRRQQLAAWVTKMDQSAIALSTEESKEQHYEVPSSFFAEVLGPHRKYSSAYWSDSTTTLEDAEVDALTRTCQNAALADGQRILELGCGWGSLTLFMAARYPNASITAVSHSATQRETILALAQERGLKNIDVITCDMNEFTPPNPGQYDRVVSVEMFEHMRNYRELLQRISTWLSPDGKLFVHIFCHKSMAYPYVDSGAPEDWMTRHFFAGGMMPSDGLLYHFNDDLAVEQQWRWNGKHYSQTLEAWLTLMDQKKEKVMPILTAAYGRQAQRWWGRWRIFFMACAEFFALNDGEEWYVSHYRLTKAERVTN
jgi:cyclopropane-fatty-acyl-phospholipid synthase